MTQCSAMGNGWSGACEAAVQRPMTELLDALYTSTVILVSGTQCLFPCWHLCMTLQQVCAFALSSATGLLFAWRWWRLDASAKGNMWSQCVRAEHLPALLSVSILQPMHELCYNLHSPSQLRHLLFLGICRLCHRSHWSLLHLARARFDFHQHRF